MFRLSIKLLGVMILFAGLALGIGRVLPSEQITYMTQNITRLFMMDMRLGVRFYMGTGRYPIWSPDCEWIAYTEDSGVTTDIYVKDFLRRTVRNLTPDSLVDTVPVWSPDSVHLLFNSNRDENREIYRADLTCLRTDPTCRIPMTNLTNNPALDVGGAWSPDGQTIAFFSTRDGSSELYLMDADGGNVRRLTNDLNTDMGSIAWSPDGKQIGYVSMLPSGDWDIFSIDAAGGEPHNLTQALGQDQEPRWSPDGKQIAFLSLRDGNFEIYLMNADGSNMYNLTQNPSGDLAPVWSPDNQSLLFHSNRETRFVSKIYQIRIADGLTRRLTDFDGSFGYVNWCR